MISSVISLVIAVAVFALVAAISLAPVESLSWWAGWNEREAGAFRQAPARRAAPPPPPDGRRYIVYLSGVSTIAEHHLAEQEARFLEALAARAPDAVIISDIFPYAPSGAHLLAAPRALERFWRRILAMRLEGRGRLAAIANLRNFLQVLVSADHRYGPIFNLGVSEVVLEALLRHGYPRGSRQPVALLGFSGGAQVGLGAAAYLRPALGAPIDLIALGGVMASDPGLGAVRRVHHIVGRRDRLYGLAAVFFPERWPVFRHSMWNRAKSDGRIVKRVIDGAAHWGRQGYFGLDAAPDGRLYRDRSLDAVIEALEQVSVTCAREIRPSLKS